jgi:hypothetical protein
MEHAVVGITSDENETLLQHQNDVAVFKDDPAAVDRAVRGFYCYSWALEVRGRAAIYANSLLNPSHV